MSSNKKQPEESTAIENLNEHLTSAGESIANNKKVITWCVVAIVIIGALVAAYLFLYRNPRIEKSFEAYNKVETEAVGNDSIAAAMYKDVADKYSNTPAGNLAALSAAEYLYDLGKYAEAAKYAEKFSTSDKVLMSNALVLIGDCYVNLKKYDDAISYFDKAISTSDENPQIVPRVLLKKATIYDAQNKYDKALECYEAISADYPQFSLGQGGLSIDAYVEREKARLGK